MANETATAETFNALTAFGKVVTDPRFIVRFKGEAYGTNVPPRSDVVADALPWQASVTVGDRKTWERRNADETVTVEDTRSGKTVEVTYGKLAGV